MEIRTLPSQAADIRSSSRYGLSNSLGFKYHIVIEPLGYTIVNNKLNTTETTTLLKQIQSLQQSKVIEIEAQYIPLSQIYVIAKSKFHWNAIEIQRLEKNSVNITNHTSTEPRKTIIPIIRKLEGKIIRFYQFYLLWQSRLSCLVPPF
jgi:hypothetical protein